MIAEESGFVVRRAGACYGDDTHSPGPNSLFNDLWNGPEPQRNFDLLINHPVTTYALPTEYKSEHVSVLYITSSDNMKSIATADYNLPVSSSYFSTCQEFTPPKWTHLMQGLTHFLKKRLSHN